MTTDTETHEPKKRTKAAASSGDEVEEQEKSPKRARKGNSKEKFKDFMLRRIVKENHNGAITKICFNTVHGHCGNIVATVGASQANIYDNENQCNRYEGAQAEGQHIDIMLQWPGSPDVQTTTCCWVRDGLGDSLLAVGGDDGSVLVLSVARTRAVADLKGHKGEILDMVGSGARDGLLATVGKGEGCVRVWQVDGSGDSCCVATCTLPGASNLSISPDGTTLLVGCKDGKVHSVALPKTTPKKTPQELEATPLGKHHSSPIDGIRYLSSGRVVSKSKDGHTLLWDPTKSGKEAIVQNITNPRKLSSSDWCSFDVSAHSGDGQHLCVGNSQGEVLVYALATGDLVARLKDSKLKKMQITACAFSPQADQVLCATEKGYIFRYDYISPEIRAVWDTLKLPDDDQGLVGCVLAGDGTVLNLDGTTFDQAMASNKLVIVSFGAYWCRFSQMLGPVWDQLAQTLTGDAYTGVAAAHVECENHKDLAMKWGISKYPTIKLWKNGEVIPKEYRGARTVQHFKSYIDSLLSPAMQTLESPEQTQSIGVQRRSVVGVFKDKENNDFKVFAEVAEHLRDFCNFHVAHSTDVLGRVVTMPHVLFKQRHSGETTFEHKGENTFTKDEFLSWAIDHCKPLVDEITFENGEEMTEEGLPFFIMFTHPDDTYSRQRFGDAVRKHVVHERSRIKFLVADGHKFEHPLKHMGKARTDLPVIAIDSFKHMYDFGKIDDLDKPGRMQEFINDLFSGKLHHDFHNTHQELPPPSELQKLGPSKMRYSFNRDEL